MQQQVDRSSLTGPTALKRALDPLLVGEEQYCGRNNTLWTQRHARKKQQGPGSPGLVLC